LFDARAVQHRKNQGKGKQPQHSVRGVIYLGRIPYGFFEKQLKEYFGQFGEVTQLRLSRSPKVRTPA
jgi:nucleolar protein 15